jgi:hypothetical protein
MRALTGSTSRARYGFLGRIAIRAAAADFDLPQKAVTFRV